MSSQGRPPYRRSLLQQERSLNTRKAILRASVELFGSRDIESITIEDLCRSAGIGRSTFYLYFQSKDQLLMALAEATAHGRTRDAAVRERAAMVEQNHVLTQLCEALIKGAHAAIDWDRLAAEDPPAYVRLRRDAEVPPQ